MNGDERQPPTRGFTPRLVLGLTIMTAGLLLALDNLGIVDSGLFFRYWPLALVALGLARLASPPRGGAAGWRRARRLRHRLRREGGVFWLLIGLILLGFTTDFLSFQRLWAIILVFVGGSIAWRALRPRSPRSDPITGIDMMAILGGSTTRNTSANFQGGHALAFMGGCEIDLRKARIEDEAVLDIFAFWGGIEIRVPEDWQVINHVNAFLGAIENTAYSAPDAKQRLVLTGTVVMGGAEVKN